MFQELEKINQCPKPFEFYTTHELWNDPHVASHMLAFHLDEKGDLASRNKHFVQKSVDWIIEHFAIDSHSKICDFGCGPGLYTTPIARTGAEVTGIDFSENSLRYAKEVAQREKLSITYPLQNYLTYEPEKQFDLLFMIFCDFCVLSPKQRKQLLNIFANSLEEKGALLFDVYSLAYFDSLSEKRGYEYVESGGFWSKNPYYAFMNTFKYEKEKVLLDKYTILEKHGKKEIFNWLQCFSFSTLAQELESAGFEIAEAYSDVSGTPYREGAHEIAVVARKKQP